METVRVVCRTVDHGHFRLVKTQIVGDSIGVVEYDSPTDDVDAFNMTMVNEYDFRLTLDDGQDVLARSVFRFEGKGIVVISRVSNKVAFRLRDYLMKRTQLDFIEFELEVLK
jgi:hypothetical protein